MIDTDWLGLSEVRAFQDLAVNGEVIDDGDHERKKGTDLFLDEVPTRERQRKVQDQQDRYSEYEK